MMISEFNPYTIIYKLFPPNYNLDHRYYELIGNHVGSLGRHYVHVRFDDKKEPDACEIEHAKQEIIKKISGMIDGKREARKRPFQAQVKP